MQFKNDLPTPLKPAMDAINKKIDKYSGCFTFIAIALLPVGGVIASVYYIYKSIYNIILYFRNLRDNSYNNINLFKQLFTLIWAPFLLLFSIFCLKIYPFIFSPSPSIIHKQTNLIVLDNGEGIMVRGKFLQETPNRSKQSENLVFDTVRVINHINTEKDTVWYMVEKIQYNDTITGWIYNIEPAEEALPEIEEPLPATEK